MFKYLSLHSFLFLFLILFCGGIVLSIPKQLFDIVISRIFLHNVPIRVIHHIQLSEISPLLLFHVDERSALFTIFQFVFSNLHTIVEVGAEVVVLAIHAAERGLSGGRFADLGDAPVQLFHLAQLGLVGIVEHIRLTTQVMQLIAAFRNQICFPRIEPLERHQAPRSAHLRQVARLVVMIGKIKAPFMHFLTHIFDKIWPFERFFHADIA